MKLRHLDAVAFGCVGSVAFGAWRTTELRANQTRFDLQSEVANLRSEAVEAIDRRDFDTARDLNSRADEILSQIPEYQNVSFVDEIAAVVAVLSMIYILARGRNFGH